MSNQLITNKKTIYILSIFLITLFFSCKKSDQTISEGLTSNGFKFAKPNENNELIVVNDAIFEKGETVNLILLSVKGFEKGTDGLNKFEMSVEVTNSSNEVFLSEQNVLGENGHILLPNDVAESPYGVFNSNLNMQSGIYCFKIIIQDVISGKKLTQISHFKIK